MTRRRQDDFVHPFPPDYAIIRRFIAAVLAKPRDLLYDFLEDLKLLKGSHQDPLDYSQVDAWIPRLKDVHQGLAREIWRDGNEVGHPWPSIEGAWRVVSSYGFLTDAQGGVWRTTETGTEFLEEENDGEVTKRIDIDEGLFEVLSLVDIEAHEEGKATARDLNDEWEQYVKLARDADKMLIDRLVHLHRRGLLETDGSKKNVGYSLSDAGREYFNRFGIQLYDDLDVVDRWARKQNRIARRRLHRGLANMDPWYLEKLVAKLFLEMGYDEIRVTPKVKDKGVDVYVMKKLDDVDKVTCAIQVKQKEKPETNKVGPDDIKKLRQSLDAPRVARGILVTNSTFTSGVDEEIASPGMPISLIDGDRLVELLVEHGLGVEKMEVVAFDDAGLTDAAEAGGQFVVPAEDAKR